MRLLISRPSQVATSPPGIFISHEPHLRSPWLRRTDIHGRPSGQVSDLGILYDAHTDNFLSASIIQKDPPPATITCEAIKSHSVRVSAAGTAKDKLASFGVDNRLATSYMAGLFQAAGSAKYLQHSRQEEGGSNGAVHYEILTEISRLNLAHGSLRSCITTDPIAKNRATHILAGITYGVKLIFGASQPSASAANTQEELVKKLDFVKSMFKQHETSFHGDIGDASSGQASQQPSRASLKDVTFVVFSDLKGVQSLKKVKVSKVESIIGDIPDSLRDTNHGRGVPLTYHLVPLDYLRVMHGLDVGPRLTVHQPADWVMTMFMEAWEKWNGLELQTKAFINETKSISFMLGAQGPQKINEYVQQLEDALEAKKEIRQDSSIAIEKLRSGHRPADSLERLLKDHLQSSNSPEHTARCLKRAIDYVSLRKALTTHGGRYFDYNGSQDAIAMGSSIYVLFFTEAMTGEKSWHTCQNVVIRLLTRNPGDYHVGIAECDPTELNSPRPRISFYSQGEVKIPNMLESMDLADQCFVRRVFKAGAPQMQPAPRERRLVRLPCPQPTCDQVKSHDWVCYHCRRVMEYHDKSFFCECGRTPIADFTWQCSAETHGNKFVTRDRQKLEADLDSLQSYEEMNILVLGESGVGKSTFINAFYNYMLFDSLDEAMAHEKLEYAVPCSFNLQYIDQNQPDGGYVERKVKVGEDIEEHDGSAGQSATQSPTVYRLPVGNRLVRLIDTPGIGDTRGEKYDRENMSKVLSTLNQFPSIHGIIILLKPTNTRLNVVFKFCVQELLTHLHRDAVRNIVWGFTNTRQSNYTPGDSLQPLRTLLGKHESLGMQLTVKTMYCFDSESFRCVAAQKQVGHVMDNLGDFRKSWDGSMRQTRALLEHVFSLEPHSTKRTMSINRAREAITHLTKPLADISDTIERTIRLNEEKIKELRTAKLDRCNLKDKLHFERIEIQCNRLDQPRTVCRDPACVELREVAGVHRSLYLSLCHDPCYLKNVEEEVVGHHGLAHCKAFKGNCGFCNGCDHHWQEHLHIWYTQTEVKVTHLNPVIQERLNANASDVTIKRLATEHLTKEVETCKASLKEIQDAASRFGLYLKKNSIAAYNDAMIEYLDLLIKDERRQIAHAQDRGIDVEKNRERLESLEDNKKQYAERIRVLEARMAEAGDGSGVLLDEEGVVGLVQKLLRLEHWGKDLQAMRELIEWSKAAGFREQQLRPCATRGIAGFFANMMSPANMVVSAASRFISDAASAVARGLFGRSGASQQETTASASPPPKPQTPATPTGRGRGRGRQRQGAVKQESVPPAGSQPRTGVKRERSRNRRDYAHTRGLLDARKKATIVRCGPMATRFE
ncbi:hypothetical protein PG991_015224 [Apiospora marii]|uniref:G domain-containing protein n=1 Tax=Apiospora marii TaxID=335849 RepID=A0ABR1R108_9PEZI